MLLRWVRQENRSSHALITTFMVNGVNIHYMNSVNGVNRVRLPPSARKVLSLLEDGEARTFKEITQGVDIAPRTIRYALKRLKENSLIIEKFNFHDARQVLYQKRDIVISGETTPVMAL